MASNPTTEVPATTTPSHVVTAALKTAHRAFCEANPKSRQRFLDAAEFLPGGNTRSVLHYEPFPLAMQRAAGNRLWDFDGHEYVDYLGEFTAGLYGHSNEIVRNAVVAALGQGINLGAPGPLEAEFAQLVCARFPSVDLVRFTNSGTEANLLALAAATTITRRRRILVFFGAYHGGVLAFARGGSPVNVPHDFLVATYNDIAGTEALIKAHGSEIAAILVEPMLGAGGCIPATVAFLAMLRHQATVVGAVLIFDEVMTSRLSAGGRQSLVNVIPDMTVLGKYIGGGMSFGAFGGRRDIMGQFDPTRPGALAHAGTFNNNVLTMAAGIATLGRVYTAEAARALNARGDELRERLNGVLRGANAPMQWTGLGSLMSLHCTALPIASPADAARGDSLLQELFFFDMIGRGIYLARRGFIALSLCIGDEECDRLVAGMHAFLRERSAMISGAASQPPRPS